jgi:sigma-B regulation protein RsbQ
MVAQVQQQPVPLRERVAELPRGLDDVVMKALAKQPCDRFAGAVAMRMALDALLRTITAERAARKYQTEATPTESMPAVWRSNSRTPSRRTPTPGTMTSAASTAARLRVQGTSGPVLVCAHSLGGDSDAWNKVVAELKHEFRCVQYDLAGHRPNGPATFDAQRHGSVHGYADDALAILRGLDTGPVTWVGHGAGGLVGCLAARQASAQLNRLLLTGTAPKLVQSVDWLAGFPQDVARNIKEQLDTVYGLWTTGFHDDAWRHGYEGSFSPPGAVPLRPDIVLRIVALLLDTDLRKELAGLPVPVTLLLTRDNPMVPPSAVDWWREAVALLPERPIDAAGHLPMIASPKVVADAIASEMRGRI